MLGQTLATSMEEFNEVLVCQLTSDPLTPDDVIAPGFRNKVLQAAMVELPLVAFAYVLHSCLNEVLVLLNQVDCGQVSLQEVLGNPSDSRTAVKAPVFPWTVFQLVNELEELFRVLEIGW